MPLHDSVMTDQTKMTTSFNLMKKRKKRKDLDKLIVRRQYNHVRTASFQDFHKISNLNDGNCVISSSDDTTTLLNSNDESIDYYASSVNRHKSKILCCNHNKFLIFSGIVNILTIIGCVLLAILVFVNKSNLDNWKYDEDRDFSKMKFKVEGLYSKFSSSQTVLDIIELMNETLINNTMHLQSLEDQINPKSMENPERRERQCFFPGLVQKYEEAYRCGLSKTRFYIQYQSKIREQLRINIKRINRLNSLYNKIANSSHFIWINNKSDIAGGHITNILFKPSEFEMKSFSKNSTAVLLSLSEYKDFLTFRFAQTP